MSRYYAVTVEVLLFHSEICAAMLDEHVEFLETSFVEKQSDSLTCRELSFLVLSVNAFLSSAHSGIGPALNQFLDIILLDTHLYCI